jgi:gas vesicle protein
VERSDSSSLKPILFGLAFGAALGLLFAPQSGEETRRSINRRLRRLRALAEEKVDELSERISPAGGASSLIDDEWETPRAAAGGGRETAPRGHVSSAREELERRLADARSRRRSAPPPDDEEPLA